MAAKRHDNRPRLTRGLFHITGTFPAATSFPGELQPFVCSALICRRTAPFSECLIESAEKCAPERLRAKVDDFTSQAFLAADFIASDRNATAHGNAHPPSLLSHDRPTSEPKNLRVVPGHRDHSAIRPRRADFPEIRWRARRIAEQR